MPIDTLTDPRRPRQRSATRSHTQSIGRHRYAILAGSVDPRTRRSSVRQPGKGGPAIFLRSSTRLQSRILDALAFSAGVASGVAASLTAAVSLATTGSMRPAVVGLAAAGTFVVYCVDRLKDIEADRAHWPDRSLFIEARFRALLAMTIASAVGAAICAIQLGPASWLLCGAVACVGLLHRRLKHIQHIKTLYVSLAWVAVVIGLPLVGGPDFAMRPDLAELPALATRPLGLSVWALAILLPAIAANLVASNLGDLKSGDSVRATRNPLFLARALAAISVGLAAAAPTGPAALGWVGACQLAALIPFRRSERYRLIVVDGALGLGGLMALLMLRVVWGG